MVRIKTTILGSWVQEKEVLCSMFGSLDFICKQETPPENFKKRNPTVPRVRRVRHNLVTEQQTRKEVTFIGVWFHPFHNAIHRF